jgi:hypothetical protein
MVTAESRTALARSRFFLEQAKMCPADCRVEFEAYIEASIVFARAAIHRFQHRYEKHPRWKSWWDALHTDPAGQFFRTERDHILKEAPPKIGQMIFVPSIGSDNEPPQVNCASEFYFFDRNERADETIDKHLRSLEVSIRDAEQRFSPIQNAIPTTP